MRKFATIILVAGLLVLESIASAHPMDTAPRVEISISGGTGSVFLPGDSPDLWIIADDDCYVMVYEIDSEGYLRVLYPRTPYESGFTRGGRAYRICRPGWGRYYVSGPPGVVYVHVVASPRPFRRVYWDGCDGYAKLSIGISWDNFNGYFGCVLPPRVYGDPYVAMQTIDEFICADMVAEGIIWADFTYFYVGHRVSYPGYLCYDCHGFGCPFDPYVDVCLGFTINIVNPRPVRSTWGWWWWCAPHRIYCGPRYVCIERHSNYWDRSRRSSVYKWKSKMEPQHSVERSIRDEMVSLDRPSRESYERKAESSEKSLYARERTNQRQSQAERTRSVRHEAQSIRNVHNTRERSITGAILEMVGKNHDKHREGEKRNSIVYQKHGSGNDLRMLRSESNRREDRVTPSVRTRRQRESQTKRRGVTR